jgi:RNA polymerase sigma factor (TIGR02999 family)
MTASPDLTALLGELQAGDASARERLWPLVYDELHALAARAMREERAGHTLQATALVHEAWLRLADGTQVGSSGLPHFLATAAGVIRHVLVDHARARAAEKRGGERRRISLTVADGLPAGGDAQACAVDVLALDEALRELARLSERQAKVVELRWFAGLDVDETAAALGVSARTVTGDWRVARAWLAERLADHDDGARAAQRGD